MLAFCVQIRTRCRYRLQITQRSNGANVYWREQRRDNYAAALRMCSIDKAMLDSQVNHVSGGKQTTSGTLRQINSYLSPNERKRGAQLRVKNRNTQT